MVFWQRFIDFLRSNTPSKTELRSMILEQYRWLLAIVKTESKQIDSLRAFIRKQRTLLYPKFAYLAAAFTQAGRHPFVKRLGLDRKLNYNKPIFKTIRTHQHTLASFAVFATMFSLGFGFGVSTSQNFYIPLESKEVFLLAQNDVEQESSEEGPFKELHDQEVNAPESVVEAQAQEPQDPTKQLVEVQRGDTLVKLLTRNGVTNREAYALITAVKPKCSVKDLQPGQIVTLNFKPAEGSDGSRQFAGLSMGVTGADLSVERNDKGHFLAKKTDHEVVRDVVYLDGRVKSTFLEATASAGVPRHLMNSVVKSFANSVNFSRVRRGSTFEVVFERFTDKTNGKVKNGNILYAAVDNGTQKHCIYRYKCLDGQIRYLNQNGDISSANTMVRPVEYCKIASPYGMRLHPIKKRHIMHTGIDYAASVGKPVKSVWPGRVEYMGWRGGYGRCVDIRHSNGYLTRYAHLNNFSKGLYRGMHVGQGQRVGSVGASGTATGPHLHFEIRDRRNKPLNPATNTNFKIRLSDRDMRRFKNNISVISNKISQIRTQPEFAEGKSKGGVRMTSFKAPEQLHA